MLPVALGLGAAACIGVADFAGGIASRRLSSAVVGFWAQGTALVLAALLLGVFRPPLIPGQIGWGLLAGIASGIGIAFLYRAMTIGAIALVTPITACSVAIPVVYSVATGETLTTLETAGIVAIISGVVLASLPSRDLPDLAGGEPGAGGERLAVTLAIAATVTFGIFFIVVDLAPRSGGWDTLWTGGAVRLAAFGIQAALVLWGPWSLTLPGAQTGTVVTAGLLDQLSLVLVVLGTMTNAYGIVTALIGLYPVVTALLGIVLLGERLTRVQSAGATLALAGVFFVSA